MEPNMVNNEKLMDKEKMTATAIHYNSHDPVIQDQGIVLVRVT